MKTHSSGHGGILLSDRHQVSQEIFRLEESEPHVRGPGPFLQDARVEVVLGRGPIVQDRDGNLTTLQGNDLGVLGGADDGIVPGYGGVTVDSEVRYAVVIGVGKVLPGRPGLTEVLGLF